MNDLINYIKRMFLDFILIFISSILAHQRDLKKLPDLVEGIILNNHELNFYPDYTDDK
jgi:hypothetical protein